MVRIRATLQEAVCFDPKDVLGSGGEFYVIGTLDDDAQYEDVATEPIQFGANQTKAFGVGVGVVLDKQVPSDRVLEIGLTAFDEDAAKGWTRESELVEQIATAVRTGLAAIPIPYTAGAALALPFAVKAAGAILVLDKNDNLRGHVADFPVRSLAEGTNSQQRQFGGQCEGWMARIQQVELRPALQHHRVLTSTC